MRFEYIIVKKSAQAKLNYACLAHYFERTKYRFSIFETSGLPFFFDWAVMGGKLIRENVVC